MKVDTYIICNTDDTDEAAEYNSHAKINYIGGVTGYERIKESIGAEGGEDEKDVLNSQRGAIGTFGDVDEDFIPYS